MSIRGRPNIPVAPGPNQDGSFQPQSIFFGGGLLMAVPLSPSAPLSLSLPYRQVKGQVGLSDILGKLRQQRDGK